MKASDEASRIGGKHLERPAARIREAVAIKRLEKGEADPLKLKYGARVEVLRHEVAGIAG